MSQQEEWRPLAPLGYPGYNVSDRGRISKVVDVSGGVRYVPISINQNGHRFVPLRMPNGKLKQRVVNKLVAEAFLPPEPSHIMESVIHLDGNRAHLNVENLAWRPRWFATKFHSQFNKRMDFPEDGPIRDTTEGVVYKNVQHVAHTFGVLMTDVYSAAEAGHGCVMFTDHRFAWEIT